MSIAATSAPRQEETAKNWLLPRRHQAGDNEEHHHDRIGVAMKSADHERNWIKRKKKERPERRATIAHCAGQFPNDQARDEVSDNSRQSEKKRKSNVVMGEEIEI